MSIARESIGEHAAHWRRVLGKPDPVVAERKLTQAERFAAWSAQIRQDNAKGTQTRMAVEQIRRNHQTEGAAYRIGDYRHAMDGTRWKRVA